MTRAWAPRIAAALWLVVGGFGVYTYAANYYQYRGFPPPRDPSGIRAGTLKTVTFQSAALGTREPTTCTSRPAIAPEAGSVTASSTCCMGRQGRPGGSSTRARSAWHLTRSSTAIGIAPLLIVMPDGRDGSFASDTEWADTAHGRYESFVLDTVRDVDRRFPTVANRSHRVIAGNSEGAYAAANLGLRHLRTFGALEAWSGYYRQTRTGVFANSTPSALRSYSPADTVRGRRAQIARLPLRAYLYAGAQDPDVVQLAPFAADLRAAGAHVEARVLAGRHDWRLWRAQTPAMLRWAAAAMA